MQFFHEYHDSPQIIHNNKIFFEAHLHDALEIIALYEGHAALTVDGSDYELNAGDFLIVFPNMIHSYVSKEPVDVGKFIFSTQNVPELQSLMNDYCPKSPVIPCHLAEKQNLHALSREILEHFSDSSATVKKAYLLLLAGKLLELCELVENQQSNCDIVIQILNYCRRNFRQKLTQKDVARALHISDSYLSHLFMYRIRINFCNYINSLRINEACSLLQQSNQSVIEIAEECGFSSLRTFNRAFLRHIGVPPREYRKSP